ncbi:MAG: hypothetical protein HC819_06330 [Cyclobacteriaceae bacterium]|nr:hypothetical protein [Cyclobacteriaceae bacterium]
MRYIHLLIPMLLVPAMLQGQHVTIEEGKAVGALRLGQSFEEVVSILGFGGDLKTYDEYLAEELFSEDPDKALECVLGFEYFIKYEHLLTLPVSYVYFKDNKICQIKVSSFPEYYFNIAKDSRTSRGLDFWAQNQQIVSLYGNPDFQAEYEDFILNTSFYFDEGIAFDLRDKMFRIAHIFEKPSANVVSKFTSAF